MGNRIGLVLMRGVIWGVVGALYAALFATLWQVFDFNGMGSPGFLLAAALAGVAGAAVYGAMQVAIVGTLTGIVASTAYMMAAAGPVPLSAVVLVAGAAGAVLGALIQLPGHFTRGAPLKAVNGLVAGAVAGGLVLLFKWTLPEFSILSIVSGLLVIATGFLYVGTVEWWVRYRRNKLVQAIITPLVSAIVSGLVGGGVWILGGPVLGVVDAQYNELIGGIAAQLRFALIGGAVAGAVSGAMLELFGFRTFLETE